MLTWTQCQPFLRRASATMPAIDPSLIYAIGRVDHGIRRELGARLAGYELSVAEFTALSILARRSHLSNAQLARRTMVTPQSMLEILAKLEDRGLVRRDVHPDHRRIRQTELTRDGRALITRAGEVARELQDELMAAVPARERQVVLDAMLSAMERLRDGLGERSGKLSTEPRGAPISPQPK